MADILRDLQVEAITQRMVLSVLWSNYLANSGGDAVATARRLGTEMADAVELHAGSPTGTGEVDVKHEVLAKLEAFWREVEGQVAKHRAQSGR